MLLRTADFVWLSTPIHWDRRKVSAVHNAHFQFAALDLRNVAEGAWPLARKLERDAGVSNPQIFHLKVVEEVGQIGIDDPELAVRRIGFEAQQCGHD